MTQRLPTCLLGVALAAVLALAACGDTQLTLGQIDDQLPKGRGNAEIATRIAAENTLKFMTANQVTALLGPATQPGDPADQERSMIWTHGCPGASCYALTVDLAKGRVTRATSSKTAP